MNKARIILGGLLFVLAVAGRLHAETSNQIERFLDKLPPDQRQKIVQQAQEAVSKMSQTNAQKLKTDAASQQKYTVEVVKDLYKKAEEAYKNGDFNAAYNYYAAVVNANAKGLGNLQDRAKQRLSEIEAEAIAIYNQADIEYRKGEHVKAAELLDKIIEDYPYCSVAEKAKLFMRRITADPKAASDIGFARGLRYEQAEDYAKAVKIYREIAEKYGKRDDTSASQWYTGGIRAQIKLDQLLKDPAVKEAIERAEKFEARGKAPSILANARNYITNKRYDLARNELDMLIEQFPGTDEATQAEVLLKELP